MNEQVTRARIVTVTQELRRAGDRRQLAERERSDSHKSLAQTIRNAAAAGLGPTEIAAEAGVSRQTVHSILRTS